MDEQEKPYQPSEIQVTTHEAWPAATEVTTSYVLESLSGPLAFNLRALSLAELRSIEAENPLPEAPVVHTRRGNDEQPEKRDYQNAQFQKQWTDAVFARWVATIDKCWKPLPGTTLGEKVKWCEENLMRNGEISALDSRIRSLSGSVTLNGRREYTGYAALSAAVSPVEASPETWAKASQVKRVGYRIPHETVLMIQDPSEEGQPLLTITKPLVEKRLTDWLVFELAGLSQQRINQIRETCQPPAPPMRPEKQKNTLTGRMENVPGTAIPDYTDPTYQKNRDDGQLYESCLLLEAALFPFPGTTKQEKLAWLEKRPAFEVLGLQTYLSNNVLSYRASTDFT